MSEFSPDATRSRNMSPVELHPVARDVTEWQHVLQELGEKKFRAKQIFRWIHHRGVFDPGEMTDLSKGLRETLASQGVRSPLSVQSVTRSKDGTRKLLLSLGGESLVECVLIPMTNDGTDADAAAADDSGEDDASENEGAGASDKQKRRVTLCISTQVGCAMGCKFCASGQAGLTRGLGAAEIVSQVLISKRYLDPDEHLRNLVYMGMGEPLHHYDETARSIRLITDPRGLAMSARRITVSTVGLVPGIARLGSDFKGKVGLAVSLHAPDDETRNQIMPINQRFGVSELMAALRKYPLLSRRRITIEYTLIDGVNDSRGQAAKLSTLLGGLDVKVNLIPMNPIEAANYSTPSAIAVEKFRRILSDNRIACSVRKRRGDDVDAACGQLALKQQATYQLVELRR